MIAAALVILTLGVAAALGMQEQELVAAMPPTATSTVPLPSATSESVAPTELPSSTPLPVWTASPEPSPVISLLSPTAPSIPTAQTGCARRADWVLYRVKSGETLSDLAWRYFTSEAELVRGGCLPSRTLRAGQLIYVPNVTPRNQTCSRPHGWVDYIVQWGDTLFSLALRTGSRVDTLRQVNCLRSDNIFAGQVLWVPRRPYQPTATRRPTAVGTATAVPTAITPTPSDSQTPGPTGTEPVTPETPTAEPPTATAEPPTPTSTTALPPVTDEPSPTRPPAPATATPVPPTAVDPDPSATP